MSYEPRFDIKCAVPGCNYGIYSEMCFRQGHLSTRKDPEMLRVDLLYNTGKPHPIWTDFCSRCLEHESRHVGTRKGCLLRAGSFVHEV
jgi:hypothetical protein